MMVASSGDDGIRTDASQDLQVVKWKVLMVPRGSRVSVTLWSTGGSYF